MKYLLSMNSFLPSWRWYLKAVVYVLYYGVEKTPGSHFKSEWWTVEFERADMDDKDWRMILSTIVRKVGLQSYCLIHAVLGKEKR